MREDHLLLFFILVFRMWACVLFNRTKTRKEEDKFSISFNRECKISLIQKKKNFQCVIETTDWERAFFLALAIVFLFYDENLILFFSQLTLIHGWSKTSEILGRWSGLGDNIFRTKSFPVDDIDFHSGISNWCCM